VKTPPARPDLAMLAARLPARPLTRFAPSPTGALHLGHVVNAIYVWGVARALGGRVLLRFEDHDRARSREAFERAALDDLEWLGLEPDIGLPSEFRAGASPFRQSDSDAAYAGALARLRHDGRVYACGCSRKAIAAVAGAAPMVETPYPGTCRERNLAEGPGRGLRVRLEPGEEPFEDARLGTMVQSPAAQCGDLLARDRHGYWTYQFAVVVDDLRHGVDLVVRGVDLLASTGRQIQLARLLGRARPPVFLHHGLILKADGQKLSKSSGDTGVADLRARGHSAAEVIGLAAHAAGLTAGPRAVPSSDLVHLFADERR
jgi:glutamyl-tRNA synthetase/glutamyl-Q tRNA(Asp) synthetase